MSKQVKHYTKIMDELIRSDKLTPNEKAVLSVLISYADCEQIYLKQSTIAKQSNMSRDTVNRVIKSLRKGKYIKTVEIPDRSNLEYKVLYGQVTADSDRGVSNTDRGCGKFRQGVTADSDSSIKRSSIKNIDKEKDKKEKKPAAAVCEAIIAYLNDKAGRKFEVSNEDHHKYIRSRWKKYPDIEKFKFVIDVCCAKWKGNEEMQDYLQPSTLFNGKFAERLGWTPPKQSFHTYDPLTPKSQADKDRMIAAIKKRDAQCAN
jgi:uncharacterized phage protein (TIGR02220 family)